MKYVLGSGGAGHSFVVGFGTDPPVQCHHRAASCPDEPATCDFDNYNAATANPQTLYGAMVGGERPVAVQCWFHALHVDAVCSMMTAMVSVGTCASFNTTEH